MAVFLFADVRYWHLADIPKSSPDGGKADIALTALYVRLWPMLPKQLILQAQGFPVFQCFTILFAGRS